MKSPDEVREVLRRQWENGELRARRLLRADAWPFEITIGLPNAAQVVGDTYGVSAHVQRWRSCGLPGVIWTTKRYRDAADDITLPAKVRLEKPSQWIDACDDRSVKTEFDRLAAMIESSESCFHGVLIRRRGLWRSAEQSEVLDACRIASQLSPGIARRRPLRLLSEFSVDTKFFERHRNLLQTLLDQRFGGEVSRMGLFEFLDVQNEAEHWLLVIDLDGGLLPYRHIRVRSRDLHDKPLPVSSVLIVENEMCSHLLPKLPDTIAVLGSGLDVQWLDTEWLRQRYVGYWGDIDTWGLLILDRVRKLLPKVATLMMDRFTFESHASNHVTEHAHATIAQPTSLTADEQAFFEYLAASQRGRLEQEFLPLAFVQSALRQWREKGG